MAVDKKDKKKKEKNPPMHRNDTKKDQNNKSRGKNEVKIKSQILGWPWD